MKTRKVSDIKPGDRLPMVRTVVSTMATVETVDLVFDDGTTARYDLSGDPAIEVEDIE